ncbi:MAG: GIY-YIG nuclease family protein [Bacteroidetes bacterium]|nr:GIY-YIG nuclease family protein [Bacteroidota bacterium]
MKFFLYHIKSEEGYIYTGQTSSLEQRLIQHNSGKSFYTKRGTNWKLVHFEEFSSRTEAMKKEKYYKTGKGRDELQKLLSGS